MDRLNDIVATLHAVPGLALLVLLALAASVGSVVHAIVFHALGRAASRRPEPTLAGAIDRRARRPSRVMLPVFFALLVVPLVAPDDPALPATERILSILLIGGMAWLLIALTHVLQDRVEHSYRIDVADNLHARRIHTQFDLIRKVATVIIAVIAGALVLLSFDAFRAIGTGLLASAGVAGIILGFAAQRTIGNLFAGLQIALTQPIRVDDVVVVEGEWGRIEEITLTYVVVRIWDLRRLILPVSYFIENPFQNWTRVTADILGTVMLHVDYRIPFDQVRAELRRIVEGDERWDGKVCVLHVIDAGPQSVEIRALVSAAESGLAWELRCAVRERLIEFIQREHPDCLPRVRAELEPATHDGEDDARI